MKLTFCYINTKLIKHGIEDNYGKFMDMKIFELYPIALTSPCCSDLMNHNSWGSLTDTAIKWTFQVLQVSLYSQK